MEDSKSQRIQKPAHIPSGALLGGVREPCNGNKPSLAGGAIGDGGTAQYDREPRKPGRCAEQMLADETFLNRLFDKMLARLVALQRERGAEGTVSLAAAAKAFGEVAAKAYGDQPSG